MSTQARSQDPYPLEPCTLEDVPGLADVYIAAFADNQFAQASFPPTISDAEMKRWLHARFSGHFSKRENRFFKITDISTGKIVAFQRWHFPTVLTDEEKAVREKENAEREREKKEGKDSAWPIGANLEVCEAKFGGESGLEAMTKKYVDKENMYVASLLATSPSHQRKGLGSKLLKYGLELADQENRRTYIEATDDGYPLYWKLGFRDVDHVVVDLRKWGGDEGARNRIMIREVGGVKN